MTGAPADWRLDNSWKEGGRVDAGADAASANAFNQPSPGYPQYQLLALAVENDKMTKMYPTNNNISCPPVALYVVMHSGQLTKRTQLAQKNKQTNMLEKSRNKETRFPPFFLRKFSKKSQICWENVKVNTSWKLGTVSIIFDPCVGNFTLA